MILNDVNTRLQGRSRAPRGLPIYEDTIHTRIDSADVANLAAVRVLVHESAGKRYTDSEILRALYRAAVADLLGDEERVLKLCKDGDTRVYRVMPRHC